MSSTTRTMNDYDYNILQLSVFPPFLSEPYKHMSTQVHTCRTIACRTEPYRTILHCTRPEHTKSKKNKQRTTNHHITHKSLLRLGQEPWQKLQNPCKIQKSKTVQNPKSKIQASGLPKSRIQNRKSKLQASGAAHKGRLIILQNPKYHAKVWFSDFGFGHVGFWVWTGLDSLQLQGARFAVRSIVVFRLGWPWRVFPKQCG